LIAVIQIVLLADNLKPLTNYKCHVEVVDKSFKARGLAVSQAFFIYASTACTDHYCKLESFRLLFL